jgi:hypothetical protein
MKIYRNLARLVGVIAIASLFTIPAYAANIPTLSLYSVTAGSSDVQITVYGADPNASVLLYYPSTSSLASANIGTTNSSGYLTDTVDASTYGITSGASVYVMVDGQASAATVWPSFSTSGTLGLSETNLIMSTGQSSVVSASVSAPLSVSTNTNPSVATAAVSGTQITVTAFNQGETNITICASGLSCNTIQVNVQSSGSSSTGISFSPSGTITVGVGQSQTVAISGSGNYYISSNSASGFVSANLSGSILTLGGVNSGSSNITICSSGGNSSTCGTVIVDVTQSNTSTVTTTTTTPLTFSQSNATLSVGQSEAVAIYGGEGGYYISSNSAPSSVSANINGNNVNVIGLAFGGDNINVCSINGQCGIVYVYVSSTGVAATTVTSTTVAPELTSFSISSNDADNNFIGAGNAFTITFSANQSINIPSVTVAGAAAVVNGSGNGPYTATYSMTGNESFPIPVAITFSNPAGSASSAYFWIGNSATAPSTATTPASTVSSSDTSSASSPTFTEYLYNGSTGPQVTALQQRLTADGVYSGPITGTFGDLTEAAVKLYQKNHDIEQLGVVGPATRGLLNEGI